VFGAIPAGVMEVPAGGGEPKVIIPIARRRIASNPQLLPDGRAVLYSTKAARRLGNS
jgi:hypothetical protein